MPASLDLLARRDGFNTALRHVRITSAFVKALQEGANLADLVIAALQKGELTREQIGPLVHALLVEKYRCPVRSGNAPRTIHRREEIAPLRNHRDAGNIVISYQDPERGLFLINPENDRTWEEALPVLQDELLVVYLLAREGRELSGDGQRSLFAGIFRTLAEPVPEGRTSIEPAPPRVRRYSVPVTNELFHNGNVEAWKRIISSYSAAYPAATIVVWYQNERVHDLNALFSWGKVQHGTVILFTVLGEPAGEISRLQRYLQEGASPRFEVFLQGELHRPLPLFGSGGRR